MYAEPRDQKGKQQSYKTKLKKAWYETQRKTEGIQHKADVDISHVFLLRSDNDVAIT